MSLKIKKLDNRLILWLYFWSFSANAPCDESCDGGMCVIIGGEETCDCFRGYAKNTGALDACLGEIL